SYKRQFAAIHALTRTRTRFTVGALVTATVMALAILAWLPSLAVCCAAVFWGVVALLRHQRLQPWCPYCGGGGSAHDPTVTAPPTPTVGVRPPRIAVYPRPAATPKCRARTRFRDTPGPSP